MNATLATWNEMDEASALDAMLACCASRRWAAALTTARPIASEAELYAAADRAWNTMSEPDWLEAFSSHPRIGERRVAHSSAQSSAWSRQEQSSAESAPQFVLAQLAEANARYQDKFGFNYIVCATGKSAEEMLSILRRRLDNHRSSELREAAEQQRQIMQIRLRKWLAP